MILAGNRALWQGRKPWKSMHVLLRVCLCLVSFLPVACRSLIDAVNLKQLAPEIAEYGSRADSWYSYMPEYAPYFCLKTRAHMIYTDPEMQLGYWLALHPEPPHRVMMEARGNTLILHRSFVWDGMSFGRTSSRELIPSLLHDALYYAMQGKAPLSRREVDKAFLRACRRYGCSGKYTAYLGVRTFGGLFGIPPGAQPPRIVLSSPESAPLGLEPTAISPQR